MTDYCIDINQTEETPNTNIVHIDDENLTKLFENIANEMDLIHNNRNFIYGELNMCIDHFIQIIICLVVISALTIGLCLIAYSYNSFYLK
jgi:hypothetical protein